VFVTGVRLAVPALLLGFGANKLLAQLFLAHWELLTWPEPDLAARGTWLLALFLLHFTALSAITAATAAIGVARGTGGSPVVRGLAALGGATSGALLILIGVDPTAFVLHAFTWAPAYYGASIATASVIMAGGIKLAIEASRRVRPAPGSRAPATPPGG
jgi:hypothetical protein